MAEKTTKSSEVFIFLSREKHLRFRTLTSLLEMTEGVIDEDLESESEDLQDEEPSTRQHKELQKEWSYINCFASLLVRDSEDIAIVPTSSPGREELMIAFNSTHQQELAPEIAETDTANDLGILAVYKWFFENGGDHMPLKEHIHRTFNLIREWHRHENSLRYNILWRHSLLASRVKMAKRFIAGMGRIEDETWTGPTYFSYLAADAALMPDALLENVCFDCFQEEPFCQPPSAEQLAFMDKYLSEYDRPRWSKAPIYGSAQSRKTFQTLLSAVVRQAWEDMRTFMRLVQELDREYKKYVLMRSAGFEKKCRQVDELASTLKTTFRDLETLRLEFNDVLKEHLQWMEEAFQPGESDCHTANELLEEVQSIIVPIEGLDMNAPNNDRRQLYRFEASGGWADAAENYIFIMCTDYWSIQLLAPSRYLSPRIAMIDITTMDVAPKGQDEIMAPVTDILDDTTFLDEARRHLFKKWFMSQEHISDVYKNQLEANWEGDGLENRRGEEEIQRKAVETTNKEEEPWTSEKSSIKRKDSQQNNHTPILNEKNNESTTKTNKTTTTPSISSNEKPISGNNEKPISSNNEKPISSNNEKPISSNDEKATSMPFTGTHDPATILLSLSLLSQSYPKLNVPTKTPFAITASCFKKLNTTRLRYISTTNDLTPAAETLIELVKDEQKEIYGEELPLLHPTARRRWSAMCLPLTILKEEGEEILEYVEEEWRERIEMICDEEEDRFSRENTEQGVPEGNKGNTERGGIYKSCVGVMKMITGPFKRLINPDRKT
ncbi:hypothetical protein Vi05172_g6775 [Venturia inaequalis]|nr:hypothetical protein Vi05172_g6775 [Venturia inaequalis]